MPDAVDNQDETDRLRRLIEVGSDAAGASSGAALTLILGPGGPAAGAVIAAVLRRVGLGVLGSFNEPRRQARVGAALVVAAAEINRRLDQGDTLRSDSFFDDPGNSEAEEVLEGVLQAAADSFEQRKVPYLGKLFASLTFAPEVTPDLADRLVRIAEQLTFRQLVCIAILTEGAQSEVVKKLTAEAPDTSHVFGEELGFELDDLSAQGLIGLGVPGGEVLPPGATATLGASTPKTFKSVDIGSPTTTRFGRLLYDLMGLKGIPTAARDEVLEMLTATHPATIQAP